MFRIFEFFCFVYFKFSRCWFFRTRIGREIAWFVAQKDESAIIKQVNNHSQITGGGTENVWRQFCRTILHATSRGVRIEPQINSHRRTLYIMPSSSRRIRKYTKPLSGPHVCIMFEGVSSTVGNLCKIHWWVALRLVFQAAVWGLRLFGLECKSELYIK